MRLSTLSQNKATDIYMLELFYCLHRKLTAVALLRHLLLIFPVFDKFY